MAVILAAVLVVAVAAVVELVVAVVAVVAVVVFVVADYCIGFFPDILTVSILAVRILVVSILVVNTMVDFSYICISCYDSYFLEDKYPYMTDC